MHFKGVNLILKSNREKKKIEKFYVTCGKRRGEVKFNFFFAFEPRRLNGRFGEIKVIKFILGHELYSYIDFSEKNDATITVCRTTHETAGVVRF